jgi:hypothetical protein
VRSHRSEVLAQFIGIPVRMVLAEVFWFSDLTARSAAAVGLFGPDPSYQLLSGLGQSATGPRGCATLSASAPCSASGRRIAARTADLQDLDAGGDFTEGVGEAGHAQNIGMQSTPGTDAPDDLDQ